jgi:tetratricopeptide (TPR) repeat protein
MIRKCILNFLTHSIRFLFFPVFLGLIALPLYAQKSPVSQSELLISRGEFLKAFELLEPYVQTHPDEAEAHALFGWACLNLQRQPEALIHLNKAWELAPRNSAILKMLAKAFIAAKQNQRAEPCLIRLKELAPRDPEAWSLLGRLYQDDNRFTLALPALQEALRLNPEDVQAESSLAFTLLGMGNPDDALSTYRKAVDLNSRRTHPLVGPHASFAIFLLRLNRIEEARQQIRLAEAIDPRYELVKTARQILNSRENQSLPVPTKTPILPPPQFRNVAEEAGIHFVLENSPTSAKHQIETMPGGVAVLDFDRDGWMDLYFTNGASSPSLQRDGGRYWNRLYRNRGDGSFEDVTAKAGVQGEGFMMAAAAADYDNDGYPDLFVAGVNRNILYHNNRDGTFTATTAKSGLDQPHPQYGRMWGIHALWTDYDRDGWLDLLVVNYCRWDPQNEPFCGDSRTQQRTYCHPRYYGALPNQLFHNNRDGTFSDVSAESGIGAHLGKGMGAAVADVDGDGWPDIFVANDTEPNFLFQNKGDGHFEEVAMKWGVALNQFGSPVSSMGVDFRDIDNDGKPDLFITDLTNEGWMLFRNAGSHFEDIADSSRVGLLSLRFGGWSNAIADFNNDGWKDLFAAAGHAMDNLASAEKGDYAQPNQLFLNQGNRTFTDATQKEGMGISRPGPHRGSAVVDFDNDGRLDLVVTALGERVRLFRNVTSDPGHWLILSLVGKSSNRDALGTMARLETPDGKVQWNQSTPSVGFASSSDPRIHFGLGRENQIRRLEILWPGGKKQLLENLSADRIMTVEEP